VPVIPPRPAEPVVPPVVVPEPPVPPVPAVPVVPPVPGPPTSVQVLLVHCWPVPHACPQLPQFALLLEVSTQAVPHCSPVVQLEVHALLLQTWPLVQVIVQLPQWFASDWTQRPLHSSVPAEHMHWPLWQVWPKPHRFPQVPQLFMSVAVFTHDEPQATSGDVHVGGAPVPAVPVAPLPAVPGLLPVEGLEHAAAKITKQSP
jgi:hypothetical protein